jgi:DNA replication protein DnaC
MYINEAITKRCQSMRMKPFARAYVRLLSSDEFDDLSFDERLISMLDFMQENRLLQKSEQIKRAANLPYPYSDVSDFDLNKQPGIKLSVLNNLMICSWIKRAHHVVIIGSNDDGKNEFACGIANQAINKGHSVTYFEFKQLIFELRIAQQKKTLTPFIKQISKIELLVLSDWDLSELELIDLYLLFSVLESRVVTGSLLITSTTTISEGLSHIDDPLLTNCLSVGVEDKSHTLRFKEVINVEHH